MYTNEGNVITPQELPPLFPPSKEDSPFVRLVFISDTHGLHNEYTAAIEKAVEGSEHNILLHCGDWTKLGRIAGHSSFLSWMHDLPSFEYKFVIAGNHERCFGDLKVKNAQDLATEFKTNCKNTMLLINHSIVLTQFGNLTISGVSWHRQKKDGQPPSHQKWTLPRQSIVPTTKTHVLLTHAPPEGILDRDHENLVKSRPEATTALSHAKPKLHVFGHIHLPFTLEQENCHHTGETTLFVNTARRVQWVDFYY